MPRRRFSRLFPTFEEWQRQAGSTAYPNKIRRRHAMNPSATLSQLKGIPAKNQEPLGNLKKVPVLLWHPIVLTPREKRLREALEVIKSHAS